MGLAFSSTTRQDIDRKDIPRSYNVLLVSFGILIVILLFGWLGTSRTCATIDGTTYRASIKVEDHWGNLRNPEIYFSHGSYTWVTGTDVVIVGTYKCVAGNIVTQYGDTFQLSVGGIFLTVDGITYRRVILNLNK
jgi:hypothetical protein